MKRIFFVLVTLIAASFLVACGDSGAGNAGNKPANAANKAANAAAPADPKTAQADILKVIDNIQVALNKNDADAMEKIYADNYMIVNVDGSVQNKAERLAALRSGDTKYTSFEYTDKEVRVNADGNSAASIAKLNIKGTLKGKPMDGVYRVTGVWTKAKDGWKLMSAATTRISGEDAKPDDKAKADDKPKTANKKIADALAADE